MTMRQQPNEKDIESENIFHPVSPVYRQGLAKSLCALKSITRGVDTTVRLFSDCETKICLNQINYIYIKLWNVVIYTCSNFFGCLANRQLKLNF